MARPLNLQFMATWHYNGTQNIQLISDAIIVVYISGTEINTVHLLFMYMQ